MQARPYVYAGSWAPQAAAQGPAPAEEVGEPEYNPRRVFIKLSDLELHGFTAGCRRCNLMRNGNPALGVKHLDACRLRVEQAMRDVDHPRLVRAEGRQLGGERDLLLITASSNVVRLRGPTRRPQHLLRRWPRQPGSTRHLRHRRGPRHHGSRGMPVSTRTGSTPTARSRACSTPTVTR